MNNIHIKNYNIDIYKFFLLMGVVLSHSDFNGSIPNEISFNSAASTLCDYISQHLVNKTVPLFFCVSGYLFFKNVDNLTIDIYLNKLKRRVKTLLIPYLLWNFIALIILYFKNKYLGFNGLGLVSDGELHWGEIIKGFFVVKSNAPYPIAFAFWFIRNLMIFCILSPLVKILCYNYFTFVIFILVYILSPINMYGFEWFVFGSAVSLLNISINFNLKKINYLIFILGFLIFGWFIRYATNYILYHTFFLVIVTCALYTFAAITHYADKIYQKHTFRLLISSSFFIYGFHQLFITFLAKKIIAIVGVSSFTRFMLCYCLEFFGMVLISFIVFLILKKVCPQLLILLCGGRI